MAGKGQPAAVDLQRQWRPAVDGTFNSGVLSPGESFDHVFTATGALNYRDTVFGTLRGTVTISE